MHYAISTCLSGIGAFKTRAANELQSGETSLSRPAEVNRMGFNMTRSVDLGFLSTAAKCSESCYQRDHHSRE